MLADIFDHVGDSIASVASTIENVCDYVNEKPVKVAFTAGATVATGWLALIFAPTIASVI